MKNANCFVTVMSGCCLSLALIGCSTHLTEDEKYERQAAYDERRAQIRAIINDCEAADYVIFYTGPTTHKLRDPIKRIPMHARPSDYHCASSRDTEAFQLEMGLR